jgi:Ca2+-binding RTX toxin-like protein
VGERDVGIATNNANNLLFGNPTDNTLVDSDGSSFMRGKGGNDTLITGGGQDRVFIKAGDGNDVVMDYNPASDIIEYAYHPTSLRISNE